MLICNEFIRNKVIEKKMIKNNIEKLHLLKSAGVERFIRIFAIFRLGIPYHFIGEIEFCV